MAIEIPEGFKADVEMVYGGSGREATVHIVPIITYNGVEVWRSSVSRSAPYHSDTEGLERRQRFEAETHLLARLRSLFA